MRFGLLSLAVAVMAGIVGCVGLSGTGQGECAPSEIPDYSNLPTVRDTSARICVNASLRFANQLCDALKDAGYEILGPDSFTVRNPVPPDFVIDPLTFNNWTESCGEDLWLFTCITVMVRPPYRVEVGERKAGLGGERPRVFQAYARTNLGRRESTGLADYVANEGIAVGNLVKIDAFRRVLLRRR